MKILDDLDHLLINDDDNCSDLKLSSLVIQFITHWSKKMKRKKNQNQTHKKKNWKRVYLKSNHKLWYHFFFFYFGFTHTDTFDFFSTVVVVVVVFDHGFFRYPFLHLYIFGWLRLKDVLCDQRFHMCVLITSSSSLLLLLSSSNQAVVYFLSTFFFDGLNCCNHISI